jgi:hypothetical protein
MPIMTAHHVDPVWEEMRVRKGAKSKKGRNEANCDGEASRRTQLTRKGQKTPIFATRPCLGCILSREQQKGGRTPGMQHQEESKRVKTIV